MAARRTQQPVVKPPPKDTIWAEVTFNDVKGENLQGQIPLTLSPGDYKTPDLSALLKENTDWYKDWLIESGVMEGEHGEKLLNRINDVWAQAALLVPDVDPTEPKMHILTYFLALGELKDDVPEMKDVISQHKEKALQIGCIGGEIIQGKIKSLDDLPPIYPEAVSIFKALFSASASAREIIPEFLLNCKPFCKATDESFIGLALLALDYIEDESNQLPEDTFKYLHRFECGLESFLEMSTLLVGITLPDSMRTNVLFRRVMELGASLLALTRDIFHVRHDIEKGFGVNLITFKAKKIPLKQAFDETIQLLNELTLNFIASTQRMRALYPKNRRLDKFFNVIEKVIDGNIYYSAMNKKYGQVQVQFITKDGITGKPK